MTNADEEAFYVDEALHPYFNVSDVREISVVGLDGAEQLCTVTNEHSVQKGDVTFTQGRVDSIFDFAGTVSILDPGFGRPYRHREGALGLDNRVESRRGKGCRYAPRGLETLRVC